MFFLNGCVPFISNFLRGKGDTIELTIKNNSSNDILISSNLNDWLESNIETKNEVSFYKEFDDSGYVRIIIQVLENEYDYLWEPHFESSLNDWNIVIAVHHDEVFEFSGDWEDQWSINTE